MHVEFVKSAFQKDHYPPSDRPEIAFAGKSNVGKSSLLNALVNRKKLARTSSTPGRTQAINFFECDQKLHLVDLPGYGFAKVPMRVKKTWGKMIEDYLKNRETLKAVVVILDIRRDPSADDKNLIEWLCYYQIPPIVVLTKADKISRQQAGKRVNLISRGLAPLDLAAPVIFSARTRQGVDELWRVIRGFINPEKQS